MPERGDVDEAAAAARARADENDDFIPGLTVEIAEGDRLVPQRDVRGRGAAGLDAGPSYTPSRRVIGSSAMPRIVPERTSARVGRPTVAQAPTDRVSATDPRAETTQRAERGRLENFVG